ncbi:MAG: LysR family transcriptional regulator [Lachnospiraceae bacterium]|nr:LysR family transcriptional regulator [Lachnospiraceae bacterium]
MNISYEYYRIFYYVAKYKNLTQAAEVLHNNQPNVSRTIKVLEHELGCNLLIRSNRGISLTPEGEALYNHVKIAVEQLQSAEDEIVKSVNMEKGSITIGASETALRLVVLPMLNEFKKSYPDIRIRILNHLTTQAIESVKNGTVDFSVVATPAIIDKSLKAYPIMQFRDILIGGTSYALYKDQELSLKEITSYPLVCLGEGTMTYQFYEKFYRENNVELRPEFEAATTDQILPMVENNLGIGYLPDIYAQDALEKERVYRLRLKEQIPKREVCFVENKNYPLSVAAKALKALIIEKDAKKE